MHYYTPHMIPLMYYISAQSLEQFHSLQNWGPASHPKSLKIRDCSKHIQPNKSNH